MPTRIRNKKKRKEPERRPMRKKITSPRAAHVAFVDFESKRTTPASRRRRRAGKQPPPPPPPPGPRGPRPRLPDRLPANQRRRPMAVEDVGPAPWPLSSTPFLPFRLHPLPPPEAARPARDATSEIAKTSHANVPGGPSYRVLPSFSQ